MAPEDPLEQLEDTAPAIDNRYSCQMIVQVDKQWRNLPSRARQAALAHVETCLENFIGVIQWGPEECKQITEQLFSSID